MASEALQTKHPGVETISDAGSDRRSMDAPRSPKIVARQGDCCKTSFQFLCPSVGLWFRPEGFIIATLPSAPV